LLGDYVGIATEQNFSLYGGRKIVKQTVIKWFIIEHILTL
jgi:hypothetical protein